MSHRKFEHPRAGSLGFLPKKRCRHGKGKIKHFPKDDVTKPCHMTGFIGFKSGMTHIVRNLEKPGSKAHNKEVCEPVTILETPEMIVVGVVGYVASSRGLRTYKSLFAGQISEEARRVFTKNWYASSKYKAFSKYIKKYSHSRQILEREIKNMKTHCSVIRMLCHSQVRKIPGLRRKKAHILEIQINGGTVEEKVDFAYSFFEKSLPVKAVLQTNQMVDVIGISKGKGTKGVLSRWGVTRLPRKTHRGARKVACVGAWHPSSVKWTVARAGQKGFHHRTEINKKIYRIGEASKSSHKASTDYDVTDKGITPMGGFPRYGIVREDYIIIKGSVPGPARREITIRTSLLPQIGRNALEQVSLKFIDTSSKFGHGRFQTSEEKARILGPTKINIMNNN